MIQFLQKRWVYHSLIWIMSYLALAMLDFFNSNNTASFLTCLKEPFTIFVPVLVTTYLSFWIKEQLFDGRKYFFYFLAAMLVVVVGVVLYEFLDGFDNKVGNPRYLNFSNFIFIQIFAVGLQYFKRGIVNQYQIQELKAKKAITELNALKAQLNPHFLFNTLNNIYGMNQINSEKGSEMIMELSDVMRYHLEFSKESKVKLADEIQLLRSYIKLEQLRLRDTCDVQVNFEEVDQNIKISPLLFIPFVENAFKHGTHPTKSCFVHLMLRSSPEQIHFTVKNSNIANRKIVKTNIGLQNTKRRIELLFPNKHKLTIFKNEIYHLVDLSLTL